MDVIKVHFQEETYPGDLHNNSESNGIWYHYRNGEGKN